MELVLTPNAQNQVTVTCDGQPSHTFPLNDIISQRQDNQLGLIDPIQIGARLFAALFADGSPTRLAWDAHPKRILFVAKDAELDAIPWEYLHGPNGFIVLDVAFVRGLPASQRQPAPNLSDTPLHIVAIPSNPIDHDITRLDIAGEWTRLKENIHGLESAIRLERVRPPTLEQARRLVANQHQRVVHFMGHGGHNDSDSFLLFENEQGAPKTVTAQEFIRRMEDTTFLVTLNACVSATPGETEFSNLARALTERGVPYALGMRFLIPDDDAKTFSQIFYSELARGSSVENALRQARNSLSDSKNPWAVGTPVLYTSLNEAAEGFETRPGAPCIDEHQPPLEVGVLPRAEGAFLGRVHELLVLGQFLTGEPRAKLLTVHGAGGQGKTALVREAAERFAHAWPGGVWAVSLEDFHVLDRFTFELARLLKIDQDGIYKQVASSFPNLEIAEYQRHVQQELERRLLAILNNQRALLVLDNAETFIEAVTAKNSSAIDLAVFLRDKILGTQAGLLVTSREHLGWPGEQLLELEGLLPEEGAHLFWQSAPKRGKDAIGPLAQEISRKVDGHPLSLRLLGSSFAASSISLDEFVHQVEATLLQADDKYKHEDHRHRTIYASIETSVRYLDEDHKALLSGLWIFQAPFLSASAAQLFSPPDLPEDEAKVEQAQITERLQTLFRRGLLACEVETLADGSLLLYRSLPTVRLFIQRYLAQTLPTETLQVSVGSVYAELIHDIYCEINRSAWASTVMLHCRPDIETYAGWLPGKARGRYMNRLGWVLQRIGDRRAGLAWMERALEIAQGKDQNLELDIIYNMAGVYSDTGNPGQALEFYQQALSFMRSVGDRAGEAGTLNNMATVYSDTGQPDQALELYQQTLPIRREVGDRAGEAATLNNMAAVYSDTGKPDQALELYQQALPNWREVGDRAGEAATLNNMAAVYSATGQHDQAFELCRQALPIRRAMGDRAGEAVTLNIMAAVYSATGQPGQALELYRQALPMLRAVSDRAGEAKTINNMAGVYRAIGHPDQALELYQQTLPIRREVGDRAGEAATLNNMATVYSATGNLDLALELYRKALPLMREVGYRAGEAATLNNMAAMYSATGNPGNALELYRKALSLMREVGDRAGEAVALNNMADVYSTIGNVDQALELYQEALPMLREVGDRAGEATTLSVMSVLFYSNLSHPIEAIQILGQAMEILQNLGLTHDASGATVDQYQALLNTMKSGQPLSAGQSPSGLSSQHLHTIAVNTITVLTDVPEKRSEWREAIADAYGQAQTDKQQAETEFLATILALLDGKDPVISAKNPYADTLQSILQKLSGTADKEDPPAIPLPGGLPEGFIARWLG